jgi:hypothetical protein
MVARTEADGYALMAGGYGPHVMAPATGAKIDYDALRYFTHIAMMGGESYVFAAHSALGVKSLADVVRLAVKSKEPLNFGSPGTNTLGELMIDQFHIRIGKNRINKVPHRGGAPLQTNFLGNHISLASLPIAPMLPHIAAGTVVPLVVSSDERIPALKEVPTFRVLDCRAEERSGAGRQQAEPRGPQLYRKRRDQADVRPRCAAVHGRRSGIAANLHRQRDQALDRNLCAARQEDEMSATWRSVRAVSPRRHSAQEFTHAATALTLP